MDRQTTILLRGIAITCIVVHNILVGSFGFVRCNEMTYSVMRTTEFVSSIDSPSISFLGQMFAFLGWLGVPIFVFLSGYGLEKKYGGNAIEVKPYLKRNYLKLFLLLLPAVVFYILTFCLQRDWTSVTSNILSLSLLGNIWHFLIYLNPTVYWYFGLTWELYICFLLIKRFYTSSKINKMLILWGGISIALQVFVYYTFENNVLFEWLRRNFIGWMSVFFLGIFCANTNRDVPVPSNTILQVTICVLLLPVMVLMNYHFISWLFIPFVALYAFLIFARVLTKTRFFNAFFMWIGTYSAAIFVMQTIARGISRRLFENVSIILMMLVYLFLTVILAIAYKKVYERLKQMAKLA